MKLTAITFEKTLNESMIDKRIDEKEGLELKNTHNFDLDKREKSEKATKISFEKKVFEVIF